MLPLADSVLVKQARIPDRCMREAEFRDVVINPTKGSLSELQ